MQATRMIAVLCALSIAAVPVLATQASADTHIPSGTRATVALRGWLSSADANVGDTFEAALVNDILVEGQLVVPAGSTLVGRVADVERARGMSRGGKLTLVIDRLVSGDGDSTPALATVTGGRRRRRARRQGRQRQEGRNRWCDRWRPGRHHRRRCGAARRPRGRRRRRDRRRPRQGRRAP